HTRFSRDWSSDVCSSNLKNDSLRHAAFASWLANDFDSYLFPAQSAASYKQLGKFDKKNTLMHFWAKDLMGIYKQTLPFSMMSVRSEERRVGTEWSCRRAR